MINARKRLHPGADLGGVGITHNGWSVAGACDGFKLRATGSSAFTTCIEPVVPILQQRDPFRRNHAHDTLRGYLARAFPEDRRASEPPAIAGE